MLASVLTRAARVAAHRRQRRRRVTLTRGLLFAFLVASAAKGAARARSDEARDEVVGPVQLLVIGFDDPSWTGEIVEELERLRRARVIRLVDLLLVAKGEDGEIVTLERSQLDPARAREYGKVAAALLGVGGNGSGGNGVPLADTDVWYAAEAIPAGSAAAVALVEHRWAIPLRDRIARAGGVALLDGWIHPADLAAAGVGRTRARPAAPA